MKTIITEGGLLPADMLDAIAASAVDGQRPDDFGMARTRPLSDRIAAAWQAARAHPRRTRCAHRAVVRRLPRRPALHP
jgi:hypothetical protein